MLPFVCTTLLVCIAAPAKTQRAPLPHAFYERGSRSSHAATTTQQPALLSVTLHPQVDIYVLTLLSAVLQTLRFSIR